MAERTAAVSVRLPPALKDAVQACAKADKRTMAQWVEIALEAAVKTASKPTKTK